MNVFATSLTVIQHSACTTGTHGSMQAMLFPYLSKHGQKVEGRGAAEHSSLLLREQLHSPKAPPKAQTWLSV